MEKILPLHQAISRYDAQINAWAGSLLSLAIRWYVGWQFFQSGMVKISDWSATLALFRYEYQTPVLPPEWAALAGTIGELALPVLLAAGLLSRPAAFGLFLVNAMAVLSYPALFRLECPAALNDHFYWGALLLVPAAFGPGRFSADYLLAVRAKK